MVAGQMVGSGSIGRTTFGDTPTGIPSSPVRTFRPPKNPVIDLQVQLARLVAMEDRIQRICELSVPPEGSWVWLPERGHWIKAGRGDWNEWKSYAVAYATHWHPAQEEPPPPMERSTEAS